VGDQTRRYGKRHPDPKGLRMIAAVIILAATGFWILVGAYFEGRFEWEASLTTAVIGIVLAVLWITLPVRNKRRR
jgi:uncharacterized membrane protein SpoIIM required for sporulation